MAACTDETGLHTTDRASSVDLMEVATRHPGPPLERAHHGRCEPPFFFPSTELAGFMTHWITQTHVEMPSPSSSKSPHSLYRITRGTVWD